LVKIILTLLFPVLIFGGDYEDIDWEVDYSDAIKVAKYQNKPVMVLITTKRCKWCKKLKNRTLSNDTIIGKLNSNFVAVEVTRRKDDYPYKKLRARAVPTIYFLDANGKPLMKPVIGYWNIKNFNSYIKFATRKAIKKGYLK
jgi:thioredoxin-related protein